MACNFEGVDGNALPINTAFPYAEGMSEDTCYNLMKYLGQDISISQKYFMYRAARTDERTSVAVDSTTYSSYSELLNDARFGYNKDKNGLASVKLLTLFSLNDHQPIAYTRQPGNIPDVISVLNALKQLSVLGMTRPLLVLDGGFFSEDNILEFIHAHTKFLMRGQLDGKWISPWLETVIPEMMRPSNACPGASELYCCTKRITHYFVYERRKTRGDIEKGDITTEHHRLYLHFVLDTEKSRLDTAHLMKEIHSVQKQLQDGVDPKLLTKAERDIADKFLVEKNVKGRAVIVLDDDAIMAETRCYGYFVLVSNEKMDAFSALREYRLREKTEGSFERFTMGDSVLLLPDKKNAVVYQPADDEGNVIIQLQGQKITVRHNRLKLLVPASQLYPPDYDFSIIFDTVANRKAAHTMDRKFDRDAVIIHKEGHKEA